MHVDYALRTMHYAPCTMYVDYALCTMHYALCTMHYAPCPMHLDYEYYSQTQMDYEDSALVKVSEKTKRLCTLFLSNAYVCDEVKWLVFKLPQTMWSM